MSNVGGLKVTAALACALSLTLASTAAAARPSVKLTVPAQADAGKPTALSFTAKHVPSSANVLLQRQQGTARTWRTVSRLHGSQGSVNLPALPLGVYHVRVAAISKLKKHKLLGASAKTLSVFGQVPLSALLNLGQEHTVSSSTNTFTFAVSMEVGSLMPTIAAARNDCRSVHLDFESGRGDVLGLGSPSDSKYPAGEMATLTVVQQSADPVSVTTVPATVVSLDAKLVVGQSWGMQFSYRPGGIIMTGYANGSASCTSSKPLSGA